MGWRLLLAGLVIGFVFAATTAAAPSRPSERSCLIAWNAPGNHANRARIAADGPWLRSSLRPGVAGTFAFRRGSSPTQTTAEACLLTLVKPGRLQPVTGIWRGRVGVHRWSFGQTIRTDSFLGRNVKVLPDGRVTKIYLR
jgi:hypothetical protein